MFAAETDPPVAEKRWTGRCRYCQKITNHKQRGQQHNANQSQYQVDQSLGICSNWHRRTHRCDFQITSDLSQTVHLGPLKTLVFNHFDLFLISTAPLNLLLPDGRRFKQATLAQPSVKLNSLILFQNRAVVIIIPGRTGIANMTVPGERFNFNLFRGPPLKTLGVITQGH
jgi:hypothetical protein